MLQMNNEKMNIFGESSTWQVFLTAEQFEGRTENENSVSKKLFKKKFRIYFENIVNQIIIFCG